MELYFKNKEDALQNAKIPYTSGKEHSAIDALMLLINGIEYKDLSNLCKKIQKFFDDQKINLTIEQCYDITQGKSDNPVIKNLVYDLAYECIENGNNLGNKTIMDGKINTSEWISHSLWEGKLAGQLAKSLGLDVDTAQKLGVLHDYGRRKTHTFEHVIAGYEELSKLGWKSEANACITHSFLAGGRCCNNEQSEEGFFVDDYGNPQWEEGSKKDDVTLFLEQHEFNDYDFILNISDLMATGNGIVSPAERIDDIATRRKEFDPANRSYFLAEFTNNLIKMAERMGGKIPDDMKEEVKASKGISLEQITKKFKQASDLFWNVYKEKYILSELTK